MDGFTIQRARDGQAYISEERGEVEDLEQRNSRIFEANRDRQLDDVRQHDQLAYQRLLTVVQVLSDEDLTHTDSFAGNLPSFMKGQPLWEYIAGNSLSTIVIIYLLFVPG